MKRRRFFWWAHAVTAVTHAVPLLALGAVLPWLASAVLVLGLWAGAALRLLRLGPDQRRPAWVTRWVDEPLSCHWASCLLATASFLPVSLLGWASSGVLLGLPFSIPGAALASYAIGLATAAWGTWGRRRLVVVRRFEIPLPNLGEELDGYLVAQLSDLHIGSYDTTRAGARWVARTNALQPDLVVVTGDLVTSGTEFYGDVAEVLSGLRAPDGVLCILGNHDQWNAARFESALRERGLTVLSNDSRVIRRGDATLVVIGLGDPYTGKADLPAALRGRVAGAPTILLSHYPHYFEAAAKHAVELVLSGHTHGGQIGLPFLADRLNLATLTRQRPRGLFRDGTSLLYVNAGLGTTGPPVRVGVAPEIALFALRSEARPARGAVLK
ncbi:MAG TPA: metallophosphoesterase [Polyangiaceae bacterium]